MLTRHFSIAILISSALLSGCAPSIAQHYTPPVNDENLAEHTCVKPCDQSLNSVPVGQTIEYLLFSEGPPTAIKKLPELIESYYYQEADISYSVNTETGHICSLAAGKHTAKCPAIEN